MTLTSNIATPVIVDVVVEWKIAVRWLYSVPLRENAMNELLAEAG